VILLLGAGGYIGQAFCRELRRRGEPFVPLSRGAFDYTRFELLFDYVRKLRPTFLINAAGYSGRPNVDACEEQRAVTFQANTLLPQLIARVCLATRTPWGHVSSGCIYSGAKMLDNGSARVVTTLNAPEVRRYFDAHPERFFGFTEFEQPNFTFRRGQGNFCAGTKALAEEALPHFPRCYLWRARIPFGERDEPANLLSKLLRYPKVYDHVTSLSHVDDFARACLDLAGRDAPFGTYNVTNPGAVTTRQVIEMMRGVLKPGWHPKFWTNDREFYLEGGHVLRSSAILDVSKLRSTGLKMRPVREALADALRTWRPGRAAFEDEESPLSRLGTEEEAVWSPRAAWPLEPAGVAQAFGPLEPLFSDREKV
jgi:dTDP-4-dehydrorhamnose reductase